jgi:hypothetical protein
MSKDSVGDGVIKVMMTIVQGTLNPIVQVSEDVISKPAGTGRGDRYHITISDGAFYVEGYLDHQLVPLVESGSLKKHALVKIKDFFINYYYCEEGELFIVDLEVLSNPGITVCKDAVKYVSKKRNLVVQLPNKRRSRRKLRADKRTDLVKRHFMSLWEKENENSAVAAGFSVCEHCNGGPCDWTLHGLMITTFMNELSEEAVYDDDGNPLPLEDAVMTKKELRYLCYTAYIALKFGYLGKGNRYRAPHCVESGIRTNFPEDDGSYVGYYDPREG